MNEPREIRPHPGNIISITPFDRKGEKIMNELEEMLLDKLHKRYPGDIPDFIQNRFNIEWEYFWITWRGDLLLLYQAVMKAAEAAGQPVWNRDFGSGFFLFYLLDKGLNPLEPHWECKDCGYIERDEQAELCFDLPVKDCPKCGKRMYRDGIHGSAEEALYSTYLEFLVNKEFQETANEAVLDALKGYKVYQRRGNHRPCPTNYQSYYYTDKVKKKDRPLIHQDKLGFEYINIEDEKAFSSTFRSITIKAMTGEPMTKQPLSMEDWIKSKPDIRAFLLRSVQDMKKQSLYYPNNPEEQMLEMIEALQPDTWTALIEIVCYAFGTYTQEGKIATVQEKIELIKGSDFRHILYAREPLQFYLRKQGIPAILDYQMVEQLRKGRKGWEMELFGEKTPLLEKDKLFNAVIYQWPRTHAINWLWRNMRREDFV
jgi:hypothetical protein